MKLRILGLAMLVALLSRPALALPIVSIDPATSPVTQFDTFFVDIAITDVTDLIGYQFDLSFDPAIVSANGIDEGLFLGTAGATIFFPGTIDNTLGTITFTAGALTGLIPGATGSGVLARLSLTALAPGTSALTLSNGLFQDSNLDEILTALSGGSVDVSPSSGQPVPEPATVLLIGTGVAVAWRRRRANRAA